jgi:hypothetical protein
MFFGLATVLGTIAIRLYESPDGKMLWDYFVVWEPAAKGSQPAWFKDVMKEVTAPGFKFEPVEFQNNFTLDGPVFPKGAFDWKIEPMTPKRERRQNSPSWSDGFKSRRERPASTRRPDRPTSGPWMGENPFAK